MGCKCGLSVSISVSNREKLGFQNSNFILYKKLIDYIFIALINDLSLNI